ncbi:11953_t:CDS:2, partial [Funneliformis geosporum]
PACPALPPPFPYSPGKSKDMVEVIKQKLVYTVSTFNCPGGGGEEQLLELLTSLERGLERGRNNHLCLLFACAVFGNTVGYALVIFAVKVVEHREGDSKNPLEVFN